MSAPVALIYTSFGSSEEARRVAMTLLQEKLIACANHLAPVISQYEWQDEFHEEQEYPALLKTSAAKAESAMIRLRELHSFDTPVILGWNADNADPDYAKWVEEQVLDQQMV